jgi:hypothetical protein
MPSDKPEQLSDLNVPLTVRLGLVPHGQKHTRHEVAGIAVELMMKSILIKQGFSISDPILSTSYDFITEYDGVVNTVQVRSVEHCEKGYYRIHAGDKVGGYSVLLAHVVPTESTYVIPWNELERKWVIIHKERPHKYEKYKDAWHLLKEAH